MSPAPVTIQQGDIYWVHIPKKDTQGSEQYGHPNRPCVVMSRDNVNRRLQTIVVVPLTLYGGDTEKLADQPPFRIVIPAAEITKDISSNTQPQLCVAKTDQVRVIDKTRLLQKVGKLSPSATIGIELGLSYLFDIR